MPLLQEAHPSNRELLSSSHEKKEMGDEVTTLNTGLNRVSFPSLANATMFTPSQLLVASQTAALMAASGLGLPGANPAAFFHPGLFAWSAAAAAASQPPVSQLSPKARKTSSIVNNNNNNNNVVTSSSVEDDETSKIPKRKSRKVERTASPIPSPDAKTVVPAESTAVSVASTGISVPGRDRQFTCGVCRRSFGYKHVLQNHERTHTGEKPFECPECHKRFTRDHHLKTHMRLHTGERPYHCEYCDRQFVQVANLRRHLRVHTGERPYACQYCTARFSDSNQLKAHVLIHRGEKPFECERCSGRFRRRHHLLHHKCTSPATASSPQYAAPALLPEQTEPEDLSMSTGLHSHSSGDSPRSSSPDMDYDQLEEGTTNLYVRGRPPPQPPS